MLASQSNTTITLLLANHCVVSKPLCSIFTTVGRCWVLLVSRSVSRWPHWFWTWKKHSGPSLADDMAPQIITNGRNHTVDFKHIGFSASALFVQTLGPRFPKWNAKCRLLIPAKRTLDNRAKVRCLRHCLIGSGVAWLVKCDGCSPFPEDVHACCH